MTATTEELTALLAHRDRDPWVATVGSSSQERPHTIASGHHLIVISHVFGPYDAANLKLMALAPELAEEVVRLRAANAALEKRKQEIQIEVNTIRAKRRSMVAEIGSLRARIAEFETSGASNDAQAINTCTHCNQQWTGRSAPTCDGIDIEPHTKCVATCSEVADGR